MRNCIGLHVWESYGHCLGSLSPTDTRISVANNTEISCAGSWTGDVSLGGLKFQVHFVVFDCKRAFDIILGKPWLHEARAVHHYATDRITISTDTNSTIINNAENADRTSNPQTITSTEPTTHLPQNTTTLDDLIEAEVHRIEALHHTDGLFAESRWARYLEVETIMEDEKSPEVPKPTGVEWFTTRAEQRAIERAKRKERRMDNRKHRAEILNWLSQEAEIANEIRLNSDVDNVSQNTNTDK
jgi:hypothetical protein